MLWSYWQKVLLTFLRLAVCPVYDKLITNGRDKNVRLKSQA